LTRSKKYDIIKAVGQEKRNTIKIKNTIREKIIKGETE